MVMSVSVLRTRVKRRWIVVFALAAMVAGQGRASAQGRGGNQAPPPTPQAAAPKDLTGYWVSVVTEDWRWRMVVPVKGDFAGIPLNPEGRRVAATWDPSREQVPADQCKAYGAPTLLRVPGRLHISWVDSNTLRIDTDSGTQTRLLHFGGSPTATSAPQLQGYSVASWEDLPRRGRGAPPPSPNPTGYLKVVTTHMIPGYLRRNGVPYSANASVEEFLDRFDEPNGDVWLVLTEVVTDPQYLTQPYVTHAQFKKLPDASGWDPTTCRADLAR